MWRILLRLGRVTSLLLVSSLGVVILMRAAPGYFDDEREMSAEHASTVRGRLEEQQRRTALQEWATLVRGTLHGDAGTSRQYGIPVRDLVLPRLRITVRLLLPTVLLASLLALGLALATAVTRDAVAHRVSIGVASLLCAVPVSVLALYCLVSRMGGAGGVLFVLVFCRDLRLFSRLLRRHAAANHLFFARAGGVSTPRLTVRHLLWPTRWEVLALIVTSVLVGLNAMLPIEVIFGVPGAGQLAWSAAMNRDLPVLLAVSLLLSLCIGLTGLLHRPSLEGAAA